MPDTWSDLPSGRCFRMTVSIRLLSCKLQPWAWADWSRKTVIQRLSGSSLNLQEGRRARLWAQTHQREALCWVRQPEACLRGVHLDTAATAAHSGGYGSYLSVLPPLRMLQLVGRPASPPPSLLLCVSRSRFQTLDKATQLLRPSPSCRESREWGLDFSPSLLRDRLYLPLIRQGFSNRRKEFRCQTVPSHLLPPKDKNPFYSSLTCWSKVRNTVSRRQGKPWGSVTGWFR